MTEGLGSALLAGSEVVQDGCVFGRAPAFKNFEIDIGGAAVITVLVTTLVDSQVAWVLGRAPPDATVVGTGPVTASDIKGITTLVVLIGDAVTADTTLVDITGALLLTIDVAPVAAVVVVIVPVVVVIVPVVVVIVPVVVVVLVPVVVGCCAWRCRWSTTGSPVRKSHDPHT